MNSTYFFRYLVVSIFLLSSFGWEHSWAQEQTILSQERWRVNERLPEYVFKVIGTKSRDMNLDGIVIYLTDHIEISRSDTGAKIQELKTWEREDPQVSGLDEYNLIMELAKGDFNFDGYHDFRWPTQLCTAGRFCIDTYQYWLFNPQTGMFVESDDLNKINDPLYFNPAEKTFSSEAIHLSKSGEVGVIYFYKWSGNTPLSFKKVEIHQADNEEEDIQITFVKGNKGWKKISREKIPRYQLSLATPMVN